MTLLEGTESERASKTGEEPLGKAFRRHGATFVARSAFSTAGHCEAMGPRRTGTPPGPSDAEKGFRGLGGRAAFFFQGLRPQGLVSGFVGSPVKDVEKALRCRGSGFGMEVFEGSAKGQGVSVGI